MTREELVIDQIYRSKTNNQRLVKLKGFTSDDCPQFEPISECEHMMFSDENDKKEDSLIIVGTFGHTLEHFLEFYEHKN